MTYVPIESPYNNDDIDGSQSGGHEDTYIDERNTNKKQNCHNRSGNLNCGYKRSFKKEQYDFRSECRKIYLEWIY